MPFAFEAILIAGAVTYLLTGTLFMLTRNMPRTNNGGGWLAHASLAAGLGYLSLLVLAMQGKPAHGEAVYNLLFIGWATAMNIGGREFLGLRDHRTGLLVAGLFAAVSLIAFYFGAGAFLPAALVVALFCGALSLHLGWTFWVAARTEEHSPRLYRTVAALLAVSGAHWLDYPVLRPVEWFAPIGFSLCAILSVTISSLLAALVLVQFRSRMLAAEQDALDAATRDPLTGLSNRFSLDALFEQAAAGAAREGKRMALLFIDLDGFKQINDRLGHDAGDRALRTIGSRLRNLLRKSDVVARIGGDEFVVILTRVDDGAAEPVVEKLLATIREPIPIGSSVSQLGASVGVSYFPGDGDSLNHLMSAADAAMYLAKRTGKNSWALASRVLAAA